MYNYIQKNGSGIQAIYIPVLLVKCETLMEQCVHFWGQVLDCIDMQSLFFLLLCDVPLQTDLC